MTRPLRTSLSWGCRWGLLGLPSAAAAPFASMTNARDGTVPAALAAQRIALRVGPRKRRAVEQQWRWEQEQAIGRLASDEGRGVVDLELRRVCQALISRATCRGRPRRWPYGRPAPQDWKTAPACWMLPPGGRRRRREEEDRLL
jgi:hypothetical protein